MLLLKKNVCTKMKYPTRALNPLHVLLMAGGNGCREVMKRITEMAKLRASTIAGYKSAINTRGGEKRREIRKAGYRFVASCSTYSNTLCVYERWDRILMV